MGDNHKRHNAIKKGLEQLCGSKVQGHFQHNLNTLALIVYSIIGSGSVQLPKLALKAPLNRILRLRAVPLNLVVLWQMRTLKKNSTGCLLPINY